MTRVLRCLVLAVVLLAAGAATAGAQSLRTTASPVAEAASALSGGETVYVDPGASSVLSDSEARALRSRIADAGGRVYVAVLPADTSATNLARQLGEQVRRNGTYAVVAGDTWSAASTDLAPGRAGALAQDATQAHPGDTAAALDAFVTSVASSATSGTRSPTGGGGGGGGGGGTGVLIVLGVLAGGGGLLAWRARRRRRAQEEAELEDLRRVAGDELSAIGEDIRLLEIDVDMPGADPRAKDRYYEAVQAYTRAEEALDLAKRPEDFRPIGQALEEGRWDMQAAKALLAGREEPERRPPCFFDPRHGPSVADVEWWPAWGTPRSVPVCAADAARLEAGEEPESRMVTVGGQRMPYWQAPGQYAPFYAGGMFGGFGGFLPGLLFGSMLGGGFGGFGAGDAWGSGWDGGGDFGGGDFGGGDFGGGDFGCREGGVWRSAPHPK
jgi:hypothetical protein